MRACGSLRVAAGSDRRGGRARGTPPPDWSGLVVRVRAMFAASAYSVRIRDRATGHAGEDIVAVAQCEACRRAPDRARRRRSPIPCLRRPTGFRPYLPVVSARGAIEGPKEWIFVGGSAGKDRDWEMGKMDQDGGGIIQVRDG